MGQRGSTSAARRRVAEPDARALDIANVARDQNEAVAGGRPLLLAEDALHVLHQQDEVQGIRR